MTETNSDIIVDVCKRIARVLKDPTTDSRGNKIEMSIEDRGKKREEASSDLNDMLDLLGSIASIAEAMTDAIALRKKYD